MGVLGRILAYSVVAVSFFGAVDCEAQDARPVHSIEPLDLYIRGARGTVPSPRDELGQEDIITREDITRTNSSTSDTLLKQVPGFSLLRRSSSLTANPTGQGVSLRGTGPSGAGRTVVMLDGIPLNDPFGGWVQWSRIPLQGLDRVRVRQGWASNHWSYLGFAGSIDLESRDPGVKTRALSVAGGNRGTRSLHGFTGQRTGDTKGTIGAEFFASDGFETVASEDRGRIDTDADSHHEVSYGRFSWEPMESTTLYLTWNGMKEGRGAGTDLTRNGSRVLTLATGIENREIFDGRWRLDIFRTGSEFESTFSSQSEDRNSESPSANQFEVPSSILGFQSDWATRITASTGLELGIDGIRRDGESNEDFRFIEGKFTRRRETGADQEAGGAYISARSSVRQSTTIDLFARMNAWRSRNIFRNERELTSSLFDRTDNESRAWEFYPEYRLQGTIDLSTRASLRSAVTYGSRIPTINEIARPFRVRNDVTEANPDLAREKNVGIDVEYSRNVGGFEPSFTLFANQLRDYVGNLTLPTDQDLCGFLPEDGICRQRTNIEEALVFGASMSGKVALSASLSARLTYMWTESEVTEAMANRAIEGKNLAQLPQHQALLQLLYEMKPFQGIIQGRYVGGQFEDDVNTLELAPYFTLDASISTQLDRRFTIYTSIENVLGEVYEVGENGDGTTTTGSPFLVMAGLRVEL